MGQGGGPAWPRFGADGSTPSSFTRARRLFSSARAVVRPRLRGPADRAPASGAGGRRFESGRRHAVRGTTPHRPIGRQRHRCPPWLRGRRNDGPGAVFHLHSRRDDRASARLRTWCNGSTRPSQGRDAGSIPVVRTIPSPGTSTSPAPLSHRGRRSDAGVHPSAVLADRRLVKAPAAFRDPSYSCHARSRQCPPDGLPCAWHRLPASSQAGGGRGGVNPPPSLRTPPPSPPRHHDVMPARSRPEARRPCGR